MTSDHNDMIGAPNPYAPPSSASELLLPNDDPNRQAVALTAVQLVQAAAISGFVAIASIATWLSLTSAGARPDLLGVNDFGQDVIQSAFFGMPAVAVLILTGYRTSPRPKMQRRAFCFGLCLVALFCVAVAKLLPRVVTISMPGAIALLFVSHFTLLAAVLFMQQAQLRFGWIVLASIASSVLWAVMTIIVVSSVKLNDNTGYPLLTLLWVLCAIVQIPIATKLSTKSSRVGSRS